jgi:L-2-hydroxyglutarate oxidase
MQGKYDLGIIGGGIVGLATAYKYQVQFPEKKIAVFEKEEAIGKHQTGRNSGVIHSGIYYKPGSYKAKNCIQGREQLIDFAQKHNIDHDICGKVIVATHESELPALQRIYERGVANEIEGISIIGPDEIKEIEPNCEGIKAIHVPGAGIINYVQFSEKLAEQISKINPESQVHMGTKILGSTEKDGLTILSSNKGNFEIERAVYCGGLQSDRLATKDGAKLDMQIVGFRGDYYELSEQGKSKVKHLIYPVPDPDFPFLGVHFTRMIDGSVECGPNAVFSFKREGYSRTSFNLKDSLQALSFKGTWKLFGKHYKQGLEEYKRAFSKRLFLKALQKLIPSLSMEDIQPARSGVRAQALQSDGTMVDDFKIEIVGKNIHVLNAPSPAATSSLSIADRICSMINEEK